MEAPRALRGERLVRRGDGGVRVTASYADVIEAQFEYPLTPVPVLQNDADDAHIRQQAALLV
ncbi:MAG: hypothetical protein GYB64_08535 [Chloroflexi bacterium]|nr:hypothetical protein [Chloroflexota bacterium]